MGAPKWITRSAGERVIASSRLDLVTGCWNWLLKLDPDGYGRVHRSGKQPEFLTSHRFSYEAFFGAVPEGFNVLHRCDNPSCVNPDHLWVGTQIDNLADMHRKGRANMKGLFRGDRRQGT